MKMIALWLCVSILSSAYVFAQIEETSPPPVEPGLMEPVADVAMPVSGIEPAELSGAETIALMQTIKEYTQESKRRGYIHAFDPKMDMEVILRLDRIVTDDPKRIQYLDEGRVVLCGESTRVYFQDDADDEAKESGDKYEVWFLMQRGAEAKVEDVLIKSVNRTPMHAWAKDEGGAWSAIRVPDPE
jgi:hypothetical protein